MQSEEALSSDESSRGLRASDGSVELSIVEYDSSVLFSVFLVAHTASADNMYWFYCTFRAFLDPNRVQWFWSLSCKRMKVE